MQCFIYRCNLKPDMYIYLAEEDDFDNIPRDVFNTLGIVEFAMELDITADTKLAREETTTVINNLQEHGFHLQLPVRESIETIMSRLAENQHRQKITNQ